jgi:hypothetical protein
VSGVIGKVPISVPTGTAENNSAFSALLNIGRMALTAMAFAGNGISILGTFQNISIII